MAPAVRQERQFFPPGGQHGKVVFACAAVKCMIDARGRLALFPLQPAELLARADFVDEVGRQNILPNLQTALDRGQEIGAPFNGVGLEIVHDMPSMKI